MNIETLFIKISASTNLFKDAIDNMTGEFFELSQNIDKGLLHHWFYSRENDRLRWLGVAR